MPKQVWHNTSSTCYAELVSASLFYIDYIQSKLQKIIIFALKIYNLIWHSKIGIGDY